MPTTANHELTGTNSTPKLLPYQPPVSYAREGGGSKLGLVE